MMQHLLTAMAAASLPADTAIFAAAFATSQIRQLPPIPRGGVYVLATAFRLHGLVAGEPPLRQWRNSFIAPCRDFVLLCDSLLSFAAYSHQEHKRDSDG